MSLNFTILLLLKYLEVDLICLFVFFAPRSDIILKTRSTLWLTAFFSANIF